MEYTLLPPIYIYGQFKRMFRYVRLKKINCSCYYLHSLTFEKIKSIFLDTTKSCQYRGRKWLKARAVFVFMASLSFMVFPFMVFCTGYHFLHIFFYYFFCLARVKLLQSIRSIEIFLLKFCSGGVSKLYLVSILYRYILP